MGNRRMQFNLDAIRELLPQNIFNYKLNFVILSCVFVNITSKAYAELRLRHMHLNAPKTQCS